MSSANDRQVGGNHYKTGGEEHWDRVWRLKLDYFQGQITKYVERWRFKNGVQDLHKARHFLDKYIELVEKDEAPPDMAAIQKVKGPLTPTGVAQDIVAEMAASRGYVNQDQGWDPCRLYMENGDNPNHCARCGFTQAEHQVTAAIPG